MNLDYNPEKNSWYKSYNFKHYFADNVPLPVEHLVFAHIETPKGGQNIHTVAYCLIWWNVGINSAIYLSYGIVENYYPTTHPQHFLNPQKLTVNQLVVKLLDSCNPLDHPQYSGLGQSVPFARAALNTLYSLGYINDYTIIGAAPNHVSSTHTFNQISEVSSGQPAVHVGEVVEQNQNLS